MAGTKRARTRERLISCALELFEEVGFEQTTVAQIAATAGVSEMTFFRYFPSKELVVLDDPYDPAIAAAVGAQPRSLPPMLRVIRGVRSAFEELPEDGSEIARRRVRIVAGSPSLRAAMPQHTAATERVIVERLMSDGVDPLQSRVATAAVIAALTTALLEWATSDELTLGTAVTVALDTVEANHA